MHSHAWIWFSNAHTPQPYTLCLAVLQFSCCVPEHQCPECQCVKLATPGASHENTAIKSEPNYRAAHWYLPNTKSIQMASDQYFTNSTITFHEFRIKKYREPKIWLSLTIFLCASLGFHSLGYSFRTKVLIYSLFIMPAPNYCALWTTLKRLESQSTKATNGWWKCDTPEKNRFYSVLMDDFSVGLHPMGAAVLCSVFIQYSSKSLSHALKHIQ